MYGPTCIFWANLTHFSREVANADEVMPFFVLSELPVGPSSRMGRRVISKDAPYYILY
jgi:hypothetical protein